MHESPARTASGGLGGLANLEVDAAIVDLDGTMVDTVGDFEVALARALGDLGFAPVSREFIQHTVGKGSEHLIRRTHRPQALEHSDVYPGVLEGLRAMRAAGWRLACLTNKPTAFARPLLALKGLEGFFEQAFGGDAFARKKPDPLPLLQTCHALGTAPARTLMLGDSSNDAAAARAAGCPVVLVSYGYNHGEPVATAAPDAIVERLDEVPNLLAPRAR